MGVEADVAATRHPAGPEGGIPYGYQVGKAFVDECGVPYFDCGDNE